MKTIILSLAILMVLLCGCSDQLEIANPNRELSETFWSTEASAEQGVVAIYATLVKPGINWWSSILYDARSDEGYSESGFTALANTTRFIYPDYNFLAGSVRGKVDDVWGTYYTGIYRANQVIRYVPGITMDENKKKRLIAEAKFLRGYFYFNLVTLFGNVPLILDPNDPTLLSEVVSTEEGIWQQVLTDLKDASDHLPPSYTGADVGRVTKGAAFALRGKALMQLGREDEAEVELRWLVEGDGKPLYGLVPNYADNFRHDTENNIESVFEIQYSDVNPPGPVGGEDLADHTLGSARADFWGPQGVPGCFADAKMRGWVVDEFLTETTTTGGRDPRLPVTVLYRFTDENGPDFTRVYGTTWTARYGGDDTKWSHKYLNDYRFDFEPIFNSSINNRVIRFADVLLLYAECLNSMGRTNEAYQYVDRVRQRSGMAKLSDVKPGLTETQFLNQLKHERIVELAGESTRWLDLVRWGEFDTQDKIDAVAARDPDFNNFTVDKSVVFPIPQQERDLNVFLPQNENW